MRKKLTNEDKKKIAIQTEIVRDKVQRFAQTTLTSAGFIYSLQNADNGIKLKVQLEHKRMLVFSLNFSNCWKTLPQVLPTLNTLANSLNAIPSMSIHVSNGKKQ